MGAIYRAQLVQVHNNARRFEDTTLNLADVVVKVTNYAQLFGDNLAQTFKVEADGNLSFASLEVSSLWFKNNSVGMMGTVDIIGTRA